MDDALFHSVRRGEVSFARFATKTHKIWLSFAIKMINRWDHPPSLSSEDLVQEMLIGCWRSIQNFDPERGRSIRVHATWNAINDARRMFHRARRAGHDGGHAPSRHEVATEDSLIEAIAVDVQDSQDGYDGVQEGAYHRESCLRAALSRAGEYRAVVEDFVRTASLDEVVERVLGSQARREALGVSGVREARREVKRLIELAASVDAAEALA